MRLSPSSTTDSLRKLQERIEKLREKKRQLAERERRLLARLRAKQTKIEARKRFLLGEVILRWIEEAKGTDRQKREQFLKAVLDRYLDPKDRELFQELFDLPPRKELTASASEKPSGFAQAQQTSQAD